MAVENEIKKHFKIKITGRVQGVWYRGSAQKKANELGILGFAQNKKDGSVYMEAEGEEAILNEMVEWCKKGPELASVTSVEVEESELFNFKSFEILR